MNKKTVTLPRVYHPGKGHPAETLAYLNPMEHDLIRRLTDGMAQRGPMGVRSYAVTSGTTSGTTMGGGSTSRGLGGGGQGGPGGGSLSAPARTAPSSSVNTGVVGGSTTSRPTSDSLSAPNRTEASRPSAPSVSASKAPSTALGAVSQAARANASGTATNWGGSQYSPGDMYSNASRSSSALNSVVNGINLAGGTNAQKTDAMLRNMGYSNPIGRAGMLGTFQHESGFNPNAVGDKNLANHAYGLGQWRNDRWDNMQNFAANRGLPRNDVATQAAFAGTELANNYGSAFRGVQNATTIPAAVAAMNGYERPSGWRPGGDPSRVAGWNDRVANAQTAFGNMAQPPSQMASAAPIGARPEPVSITETAPSMWQKPDIGGWIKAKTGIDVAQTAQAAAAGNRFVAEHPILSKLAGAIMGGGGASPTANSAFGNPQDRSAFSMPPVPPQAPQMASAELQQAVNPIQALLNLQQSMMSKGATPEELAYIQSIISELNQTQVA